MAENEARNSIKINAIQQEMVELRQTLEKDKDKDGKKVKEIADRVTTLEERVTQLETRVTTIESTINSAP